MLTTALTSRLRLPGGRPFHLLLVSLAVSSCGDWLYNVALLAVVFDRTGSATWVALTTAARVRPGGGARSAWRRDRRPLRPPAPDDRLRPDPGAADGRARRRRRGRAADRPGAGDRRRRHRSRGRLPALRGCVQRPPRDRPRASAGQRAARHHRPGGHRRRPRLLGAVVLLVAAPAIAILLNALTFLASAAAIGAIAPGAAFAPARARRDDEPRAERPGRHPGRGPGAARRPDRDPAGRRRRGLQRRLRHADRHPGLGRPQGRRRQRRLRPAARRRSESAA